MKKAGWHPSRISTASWRREFRSPGVQRGRCDRAAERRPDAKEAEMNVTLVRQKVKDGSLERVKRILSPAIPQAPSRPRAKRPSSEGARSVHGPAVGPAIEGR
jgi:hypothetical protein